MGTIVFVFKTPLNPAGHDEWNKEYAIHGDGVKDVAFTVDDAAGIYKKAVDRGATSVKEPYELKDENGSVIMASVKTYGDTTHTFVQRNEYKGKFLPGFKDHFLTEPFNKVMPQPEL